MFQILREPLRHIPKNFMSDIFPQTHCSSCWEETLCLSARSSHTKRSHFLLMPPITLNTKGINVPCSNSWTLSLYALFFSFSLISYAFEMFEFPTVQLMGWNLNASWPVIQTPLAEIYLLLLPWNFHPSLAKAGAPISHHGMLHPGSLLSRHESCGED